MIYLLEKEGLGVKAQRICMDDNFQNSFLQKYLGVRRTTKSELLVVLIQFLVVEDTRTREFCCPAWFPAILFLKEEKVIIAACFYVYKHGRSILNEDLLYHLIRCVLVSNHMNIII